MEPLRPQPKVHYNPNFLFIHGFAPLPLNFHVIPPGAPILDPLTEEETTLLHQVARKILLRLGKNDEANRGIHGIPQVRLDFMKRTLINLHPCYGVNIMDVDDYVAAYCIQMRFFRKEEEAYFLNHTGFVCRVAGTGVEY